jgi:hypothetical protein
LHTPQKRVLQHNRMRSGHRANTAIRSFLTHAPQHEQRAAIPTYQCSA